MLDDRPTKMFQKTFHEHEYCFSANTLRTLLIDEHSINVTVRMFVYNFGRTLPEY